MKISEQFEKALLKLIQTEYDNLATEVTDYSETEQEEGCCDMCSFTTYSVEIGYRTSTRSYGLVRYEGSFSDLIRKLDDYGD